MEPRRPKLYVSEWLEEFREQVVRCILREMREDGIRTIPENEHMHFIDDIEYDITEDILEYQKALDPFKKQFHFETGWILQSSARYDF